MRGVVIFLCTVVFILSMLTGWEINENRQAKLAVCALATDIQQRHDASAKYLKEHPLGVVSPKTGAIIITAAQIRESMKNQESTLRALRQHLTC